MHVSIISVEKNIKEKSVSESNTAVSDFVKQMVLTSGPKRQ